MDIAQFGLSSNPSAASLYIDGKYIGRTPCNVELASGDYQVKLTRKRYRTIDKRMHFDSSDPEISFRMRRQYQRKYQMYFQPTFQFGTQMGLGGTVGL